MKSVLLAGALLLTVQLPAIGAQLIQCSEPESDDIIIELNSDTFDGEALSCLTTDFVADMTPCAPENGYGLSAPTGGATLIKIVHDWRDYKDHLGGVVGFSSSVTRYRFTGGFMGSSYNELWSFTVNRLTGVGQLTLAESAGVNPEIARDETEFNCEAVSQKF